VVTAIHSTALPALPRPRPREVRETETLRRSDAVKTAVLRSVSHDLRSPITAIMTATDVLEDSGEALTAAEREELHSAIRLQIQRLDRFVANLLDVSRLEAGAARPVPELWTVDGLIARALEAVGPDNARIEVTVPDESPPVSVDAAQLEHALVNLLENALKFSSVTDRVELVAETTSDEVVLRITDHGPGIPHDEQESIFEPFHGRGSGLGLAIARGFVQLNGGRLWIESEPGSGTMFALAFPAVHAADRLPT
jgi:two-component system, OmpR family, sensor histidine kinase KdpD